MRHALYLSARHLKLARVQLVGKNLKRNGGVAGGAGKGKAVTWEQSELKDNQLTLVLRATSSSSRDTLISRVCSAKGQAMSQVKRAPPLTCTFSLCSRSILSSYLQAIFRNAPPPLPMRCFRSRMQGKWFGQTRGGALTAAASCSFAARTRPSTVPPSSSQIRGSAQPRSRT